MNINNFAGMSCNMVAGLLFLIGAILLIKNKNNIEIENMIIIIFLASIAIGIHGVGHSLGNDFATLFNNKSENTKN